MFPNVDLEGSFENGLNSIADFVQDY